MAAGAAITLYIDPASYHFERDGLFEVDTIWHGGHAVLEPYAYLRRWMAERGVKVHTGDLLSRGEGRSERNLYVSLGIRDRYPALVECDDVTLSAFIAMECPIVEPKLYRDLDAAQRAFRRVYSFSTSEALRPFLIRPMQLLPFHIPQSFDRVHDDLWSNRDRRFMTMINSNKVPPLLTDELYTERLRAVEFFAAHGEVDLYGRGWSGAPYLLGQGWLPNAIARPRHAVRSWYSKRRPDPLLAAARSVFRGEVHDKSKMLGGYRFALCFENMVLERWITEKLFDCLYSGVVPIYLGAPDIEDWIPSECFIDMRRFDGYRELRAFLHDLGDEQVEAYREAGRDFIASERFRPFSKQAHAEVFGRIVEEDAGVVLEPAPQAVVAGRR